MRSGAGHRRYRRSSLRRVAYIVFAQRLGFQLEEIAAQLDGLPKHHAPTGDEWSSISKTWVNRVDERIQELMHLRRSLDNCIGCGCLSMKVCNVFNHADCIAEKGAGPGSGWATGWCQRRTKAARDALQSTHRMGWTWIGMHRKAPVEGNRCNRCRH